MADYEDHGKYYIATSSIADSDGRVSYFYDVGEIIMIGDQKRYKVSNDHGFKTYQEARDHIDSLTASD